MFQPVCGRSRGVSSASVPSKTILPTPVDSKVRLRSRAEEEEFPPFGSWRSFFYCKSLLFGAFLLVFRVVVFVFLCAVCFFFWCVWVVAAGMLYPGQNGGQEGRTLM